MIDAAVVRRGFQALLPACAAAASLFVGLTPTLLDYGRFEPLDWLVPGFVTLAAMRLARGTGVVRAACHWALVVSPLALVLWFATRVMPWPGLLLMAALLATGAFALATARRRPWLGALIGTALMVAFRLGAWATEEGVVSAPPVGRVAVMTALPLFQQAQGRGGILHGASLRAPIMRGLDATWRADPIDVLGPATLAGVERLLLAQPRLLAPTELVALDDWVRRGGEVTILADPLLRWPSGYSLTDTRRPPLTSLLDPLMTHWGLTLEPATMGFTERRILASGAMTELAGASYFTAAKDTPCSLAEQGLIAYCRLGKGRAVLIADADWIDDRLWTLAPLRPGDRRYWTSDAPAVLAALVGGDVVLPRPQGAWLISQAALVSALRWALGLIVLLALALDRFCPVPKPSQSADANIDRNSRPLLRDSP
jgi:hypothetical protein